MEGFGLTFDHLGLATSEADRTLAFLRDLGYSTPSPVHDPLQKVQLVLCRHPSMPVIEVVFDSDREGPLEAILARQPQAIYHMCFRSKDLSATLLALKRAGHRAVTVVQPKPAPLFGGLPVSFYFVRHFGLIEIIEDAHG
jgi:hypothetical protein